MSSYAASSYSSFPSSIVASTMGSTMMPSASVVSLPMQQSQSFPYSAIFPPTQVAGVGAVGAVGVGGGNVSTEPSMLAYQMGVGGLGSPTMPSYLNNAQPLNQFQSFGFDSVYKQGSQPLNYAMGTPLGMGSPVIGGTPVSYFGGGVPAQGFNYFPSAGVPVMGQQVPGTPLKGPVYAPQFAGKQFSHGYQAVGSPQYQSPVEGIPVGYQNQFSQHPHQFQQQQYQQQGPPPQSPLDGNAQRRVYRGGEIEKKKNKNKQRAADAALVGGAALIGVAAVATALLCPLSLLAIPVAAGLAAAAT